MGGRGGQSLRDQSGAMRQAGVIGAGVGPMGASENGAGGAAAEMGMPVGPDGNVILPPPPKAGSPGPHGHGGHGHSHGPMGIGRFCGALARGISGPLMQILGLDRFTKGRALSGLARAGRDQNPFDMGFVKNCQDFWMPGGDVDWTQVFEIPLEGWPAYRRKLAMSATGTGKGGYEPVSREEV